MPDPPRHPPLTPTPPIARTAAPAALLTLSLPLSALGARSFLCNDTVSHNTPEAYRQVQSWHGQIEYVVVPLNNGAIGRAKLMSTPADKWQGLLDSAGGGGAPTPWPEFLGFGWATSP